MASSVIVTYIQISNKKFWEELIACFPSIRRGPHRKRNLLGIHRQQHELLSFISLKNYRGGGGCTNGRTDIQTAKQILRGSVVGWGTMQQAGKSRVPFSMRSLDFFNLPSPSSRTVALESTQPLTVMNIRSLPRGKGRAARKADNLTAICEPNG
jgi:hypothetical protein